MPLSKRINNLHLTNGDTSGYLRGPGTSSAPDPLSSSTQVSLSSFNLEDQGISDQGKIKRYRQWSTWIFLREFPGIVLCIILLKWWLNRINVCLYSQGIRRSVVGNAASAGIHVNGQEELITGGCYKTTISNGFNQAPLPHNNHNQNYLQQQNSTIYEPELSQADNPHYYQRNKLLYELHFIRSRRCHPDNV